MAARLMFMDMFIKQFVFLLLLFPALAFGQVAKLRIMNHGYTPVSSGDGALAAYWMENNADDTLDNYHATIQNGMIFGTALSPPMGDYYMIQDGSDKGMLTDAAIDLTQSGTMAGWIRPSAGFTGTIAGNYNGTSGFRFQSAMSQTELEFWTRSSSTNNSAFSVSGFLADNTWAHVVATWDTGTVLLYIDGVDRTDTDDQVQTDWDTDEVISMGVQRDGGADYNGEISGLRFYDFVWTQADVTEAYNTPGAPITE